MQRLTALSVLAVGFASLTACGSGSSTATPTSVTAKSTVTTEAIVTTQPSTTLATAATYLYVTSAQPSGSSVAVAGTTATYTPGGADDGEYTNTGTPISIVLATNATVTVITSGAAGIAAKAIRGADLPSYLPSDPLSKLFKIEGSPTAPTGLTELYHP